MHTRVLQRLHHGAASPAHDGRIFQRHQAFVHRRHFKQQLKIKRLGPAHVDHAGIEFLGGLQRRVKQGAKSEDCNPLALTPCLAFSIWQRIQTGLHRSGTARTPWVAHRHRMVLLKRTAEQGAAFVFVGGAGNAHVGNAAQKRDVVGPGVRGTVCTDKPCAVQRENDGQILDGHIVDQLVEGALQEGGVNRHHRLQSLAGKPCCKSDCMLLCNAHVKVPFGKALLKLHQTRTFAHGWRDAHQALVQRSHIAQPLAKHLGESGFGRNHGFEHAHGRVELARCVVAHRVGLGALVALTLFRDHMQKLAALQMLDVLQRGDQRVKVVPVNRADVVKAKLLKQRGRHHHALGVLFQALGQLEQRWRTFEHGFSNIFGVGVKLAAHELRQIAIQRPDGRADAHVVVVQDD